MIIWEHMHQQSEQWFRARAGRPTASQFSRIFTASGQDSAKSTWMNYARELTHQTIEPGTVVWGGNRHTDHGNEVEPEARDEFAKLAEQIGLTVKQVAFVTREDGIVGCSPDALLADANGNWVAGLEIKCPAQKAHGDYLEAGTLPDEYKQQVHGGMAVTGLDTWYFFSYRPGYRSLLLAVHRDGYTEQLSAALDRFLLFYGEKRPELLKIYLPEKP